MPASHTVATRRTLASRRPPEIYPLPGGGFLFVPTKDQWNVHEASKPAAISARAGLGKDYFRNQVRRYGHDYPWITDYLYAACELPKNGSADGLPMDSMLAFRGEATIQASLRAARRSNEQLRMQWGKGKREHVSDALLSNWRRQFKQYPWFDRWILRGETPPSNVTVVTVQQSRRASHAWDFATFCADLISAQRKGRRSGRGPGIRCDGNYVLWLRKKQIPDLRLLKWLFGFRPPEGVYIVSEALQRLRHENGWKGILMELKERGIPDQAIIWKWQGDERTAGSINSIMCGGKGEDGKGWEQLDEETQRQMMVLQKVVSLDDCLRRAKLSKSQYYAELVEADVCLAKAELVAYL